MVCENENIDYFYHAQQTTAGEVRMSSSETNGTREEIKHHRAPETAGGSVLVASTGHDSGFAT
jgi:hypothetical protein